MVAAAGSVAIVAGAAAAVSDQDAELFAAMKAWRDAEDRLTAHCRTEPSADDERHDAWSEENQKVCADTAGPAWAMLEVDPATLVGLGALCALVSEHWDDVDLLFQPDDSNLDPAGSFGEAFVAYVARNLSRLAGGAA
jgi:hypothetical protein